jgi:hypothetical protein
MTPKIEHARAAGRLMGTLALQRAEDADAAFPELARTFILDHLRVVRKASGEDLVDIAKAKGATPPDDRAFGSIFASMARKNLIRHAGFALRKKGHGTAGGRIWEFVAQA